MKPIRFNVSDDDTRAIGSLAKEERTSVSEYLRRWATGVVQPAALARRVRCELTDANIFDASPLLTTKTVREMLANFP